MTAALIPVKSLREAKTRLSACLRPEQRHRLSIAMLEDVLEAATGAGLWPVTVISTDSDALSAAVAHGARGLVEPVAARGLNLAVEHGLSVLEGHGIHQVIVLLPDVPTVQAADLRAVAGLLSEHQVVIVPSTDGGTNALGLRLPPAIRPAFGPESAARHSQAAWLAELFVAVRMFESLASDVDEPADLDRVAASDTAPRTRAALVELGLGVPAV
jgi:2-phospho-L-lactate guanylyltransferase